MSMRSGLLALLLAWLLAGCAAGPPRIEGAGAGIDLTRLNSWSARGRIGVMAADQGGSGNFVWNQNRDLSEIRLSGPVGAGAMELELSGGRLKVATSDGRVLESPAAEAELRSRLGAEVPARNLRYWMLGLAAPGEHSWRDEAGGGPALDQDGWHIEYDRYVESSGVKLPARLTATSGEARVRLIIERWDLGGQ